MFYLQRTGNANTVVYAVKRDERGGVDKDQPVAVYWRHFAKSGAKAELKIIERLLAFGVQLQTINGSPGKHLANLVSYPTRKAVIEQNAAVKPRALMTIEGETAQLECIYVEWREMIGIIPKVLHIDIVGFSLDGKRKIFERIVP